MAEYILTTNGELYHYGVKGMKWGVRRDARLLTKGRRNRQVRAANEAYRSGKIDKKTRDKQIDSARKRQKSEMADIKKKFANAKTDAERERLRQELCKKTLKEIPNANIKRGASMANALLGGINAASTVGTTAVFAAANPAFAAAYVGAGIVGVAAEAGARYVAQLGLDKLS